MKMCMPHWEELKTAIDDRGLSKFIAPSGEVLAKNLVTELQGGEKKFEPLMGANIAIMSNALQMGGLYLMTGDFCPLCELEKHTPEKASNWIKYASDEQYEKAKKLNLISEH